MSHDGPGQCVHQQVRHECGLIAAALASGKDRHRSIHAARKGIRRLRALLALVEHSDLDIDRADRLLQRLGDGLSRPRDAHVVVDAARQLQKKHPDTAWESVIQTLTTRRTRILKQMLAQDPGLEHRLGTLEQIAELLDAQPWNEVSGRDIRAGLKRSERRVRKAAARAAEGSDAEDVHRWRRRVRRLRMQLEVLAAVLPEIKHPHDRHGNDSAKSLHRLSDRLGWSQDMRLLGNLVRVMHSSDAKPTWMKQIAAESPPSPVQA